MEDRNKISHAQITDYFHPRPEPLLVRVNVPRDFLREIDSEEDTADYDIITRGRARTTATQFHEHTGLRNLENETYLIKSLVYEVPEYHDHSDRKRLPAAAEPFNLQDGAPIVNRGERFCRCPKPASSLCGTEFSKRSGLRRHTAEHYGCDAKHIPRLEPTMSEAEQEKLCPFYRSMTKELQARTGDVSPDALRQKTKRTSICFSR